MILIGTDNGIYRWFEGASWPVFHSLQDRSIVDLASPGPGVLVALDRAGQVFESVNNGQDWRTIPLAEGAGSPTSLAAWGDPPFIVLGTRTQGLARRPVGAPIPVHHDPKAPVQGSASSWIGRARSLAEGATALLAPKPEVSRTDRATAKLAGWTRLGTPAPGKAKQPGVIRAMAVGEGSTPVWYAAVRGAGLWRSTDLGVSWNPCPGLPVDVFAIRTAPKRPGSVYVATSDGCWISSDAGLTWEDRSGGLENARYLSAIEVKPGAPDVLLAGAALRGPNDFANGPFTGLAFSLYESKDGGKAWSLVRRGNPDVFENDMIADLRHDPAAPDNVILALTSGELWITPNAGAFWMPLSRQIRAARKLCPVA
ncbi:hypothetical protein SAMN05444166_4927 [Singulisphaera sp. GP187]|uniref:WD40/YVTN/BNR-like repeat-containing protein n=1 Tax=Singulisphaera sp. GP187 TaxID=1882752 RepID=UPI000925D19E|nr:hypothetical protein [Singulisphaera sp. GP187]SIO46121.1 hypothetical protein SAMN05444166_4927 [Singulisphaera sp. GP187]